MSILERGIGDTADRVLAAAKRNPEGALLLAAGVALLMRGIGAAGHMVQEQSSRSRRRQRDSEDDDLGEEFGGEFGGDLVGSGKAYAVQAASRVRRSAGNLAHSTSRLASDTYDEAGEIFDRAGSAVGGTVRRVVDDQPLTLALFGLVAGFVVGGIIPSIPAERQALRPIGRRLHEGVDEATDRIKKSTRKAGKRLSEVARERGLNKRGLEDAVRDVASAFGDEMVEDDAPAAPSRRVAPRRRKVAETPDPRGSGISAAAEQVDAALGQPDDR